MVLNIHAGHNPDGKTACGAVGMIKESIENRKVKNELINLCSFFGNTVYDCTVDDGTSQNNVLSRIVKKCNEHAVDYDISIHFNSGRNDYAGDGTTGGVECWVYPGDAKSKAMAQHICNAIASMGFKNRGVKETKDLYVLNGTKSSAILIECCFVDDKDDVNLYHYQRMAQAICSGLGGYDTNAFDAIAANTVTEPVETAVSNTYPRYTGTSTSIVTALNAVGETDTSYTHRSKIAAANKITGYKGTASQNTTMLTLFKQGNLVKAQ